MLTTGRSTKGPASGGDGCSGIRAKGLHRAGGDEHPQGGRSMHASEILFVGSGFRLFFSLTRDESRFSPCNRKPQGRAAIGADTWRSHFVLASPPR